MEIIFLLFYSIRVFAGTGVITVLEAPLLSEPSLTSKVVQHARVGQSVYIHNKHFQKGPLYPKYMKPGDKELLNIKNENKSDFYLTIDKRGRDAFIPKEFVKLVYKDRREFSENIIPFVPDLTDYRIEEPIPDTYPIVNKNKLRASFSLSVGPDLKANYFYPETFESEDYGKRWGGNFTYAKKADWDKENRFYFGGQFHIWGSESKFKIFDNGNATENKGQVGIGPFLSYDFWRTKDYSLTLAGGFTVNYNRNLVERESFAGEREERFFTGYSFTPKATGYFSMKTIFPADLQIGFDFQTYLAHNLKARKNATLTELWNDPDGTSDIWYVPSSAHWSFFVGFISEY